MTLFRTHRVRRVVLLLLCLFLLPLAGRHAWAWYQLGTAETQLERHQPEQARTSLQRCARVWPESEKVHLLSSRSARQRGDFVESQRHLHLCQRLHGDTSDAIALEWALLQAAGGNPREVEVFLQRRAENDPQVAPLVWEALAEGYIRLYRILDAVSCLDHWLQRDDDNVRALELRGLAYQNSRQGRRAADDYRRVLELAPTRENIRWRLVLCLLDSGSYEEALGHLERMAQEKPEDADVLVQLARCHNVLGRDQQAGEILESVLAKHPEHGQALRMRGQLALGKNQPALAEQYLHQAVKVLPDDYQSHWLLFRALKQQNKEAESKKQLARAEETRDRAERFGELTSRKLTEQPLDPALHYEMGALLLRAGNADAGASWLLSALDLDPNHSLSHAALADYYARKGDEQRAAEHRSKSQAQKDPTQK